MKKTIHPLIGFALSIFAIMIVAFILIRVDEQRIKITTVPSQIEKKLAQTKGTDIRQLQIATPYAITLGKQLYRTNCAGCHGLEGKGDGPKSAKLNPKPRNLQSEKLKNGSSPLKLEMTLKNGLGAMPDFSEMSEEERFAIVHYIRTLMTNPEADAWTAATRPIENTQPRTNTSSAVQDTTGPRIPIRLAMMLLSEENKEQNRKRPITLPLWMTQRNPNQKTQ
ncbi:MAG: cytochrome c [bacterium]|nr:cytochrome c [bacterium]